MITFKTIHWMMDPGIYIPITLNSVELQIINLAITYAEKHGRNDAEKKFYFFSLLNHHQLPVYKHQEAYDYYLNK